MVMPHRRIVIIIPKARAGLPKSKGERPILRMAISSESRVSLLYTNKVAVIREMGRMTSKNRGRARQVKTQKVLPEEPAFITISRKRKDCVKKIIKVSTTAINTVARARVLNKYTSNVLINSFCLTLAILFRKTILLKSLGQRNYYPFKNII